ncbi:MAG TPA: hypothetical protein VIJ28_22340, partial [Chloroflexota bacterium]
MNDTACDPAALRYRVIGNRLTWQTYQTRDLWAHMPWPSTALVGRLDHPVVRRACIPALTLMSWCTVARVLAPEGMLPQYLTALALALGMSGVWTLLERHVAARHGTVVATEPSSAEGYAAHPALTLPDIKPPPEPGTGKAFDDAVRRAITHLSDPTRLAVSPLLRLSSVTACLHEQGLDDTPLQRVAILKAVLIDLINGLRPERWTEGYTSAAHRFYNCLYYPYVLGITRRCAPAVVRDLRERRE